MNATLPLCMAQALAPFAPPQSVVHRILAVSERDWIRADLAANTNKSQRANQRDERTALVDQINWLEKTECDQ